MKFILTTKSYLLAGTGEGAMLVDADSVFHSSGFPYIPGRRLKGLIRASALEVLEIIFGDISDEMDSLLTSVFGKTGDYRQNEAQIKIPNLFLPEWEDILSQVEILKSDTEYRMAFSTANIQHYFTEEIGQTAIEDDLAKETSLRSYRVVKPGFTFEGEILSVKEINAGAQVLLYLAALNLRYMGTRRNRGFGQVSCMLETDLNLNPAEALKILRDYRSEAVTNIESHILNKKSTFKSTSNTLKPLSVKITLQSPLVLTAHSSEKNTVNTDKVISGSRIRGCIASRIINQLNLGNTAHQSEIFYQAILSGNVRYQTAFPKVDKDIALPLPMFIQKEKGNDSVAYNILTAEEEEVQGKNLKPKNGYALKNSNSFRKIEVETTEMFHNSRPERIAGKSTEDGIFYYEALSEGQVFISYIKGTEDLLQEIKNICGNKFPATLGRSRSAQYADVIIELGDLEDFRNQQDRIDDSKSRYIMVCQTPLIVLNKYGLAEPTHENLKHYLENSGFEIEKSIVGFQDNEHYIGVWKGKTENLLAFTEGSSFLLKKVDFQKANEFLERISHKGLGEYADWGYGQLKFYSADEIEKVCLDEYKPKNNSVEIPMKSELLLKIKEGYDLNSGQNSLRNNAIKSANEDFEKQKDILNNHIISRMMGMVEMASDKKELIGWINDLKDKPAGDKLKKMGWEEMIKRNENPWEEIVIYWKTYLNILRKKLKQLSHE